MHRGTLLGMDLATVQGHLRILHAHQLRVEQRRQQIARRRRYRHIEQPGLSHIAAERAALVPILND